MPVNYYPDNDDTQKPLLQWRSHGNILYSNWLNYYVYQEVPYEFINNREIIGNNDKIIVFLVNFELHKCQSVVKYNYKPL